VRILFVTQYYPPEPTPKVAILAAGLAKKGHKITVITGLPCYPNGTTYPEYRGKTYLREFKDGVEVLRSPQIPDHSSNPVRRILYYFSFPVFALVSVAKLLGRRYDAIYFYGAAIPVLGLAPLLRFIFRGKVIFDIGDLWPESVQASGMLNSRTLLSLVGALSNFLYRRADHLAVLTRGYKTRLQERGFLPNSISITYYLAPDSALPSEDAPGVKSGEEFTIAYTGMVGMPQGLGAVLDAAKLLKRNSLSLQILIIGSGTEMESLAARVSKEGITNVKVLGRRPISEMAGIYRVADALLVHLKPDTLSRVSIPSKTFSYMASGKPILMAVEGEAGDFVESTGCGIKVQPGNPPAIAEGILYILNLPEEKRVQLGKKGHNLFKTFFSPAPQVEMWEKILTSLSLGELEGSDLLPATARP
jgi:colanic acid biosynthesis glycosyl transferase WcaI